ncbi:diphthine--ammonia ligase [Candidatus Borrarchaeum sp.]|uniref:Dph6-related ATP pyrophosphatase n=1 Tax=Candidatus Borrarchaeum sp. TaxID=2846742 RepID=UPI0025795861|nr:diphthine--ammonia ligase [Candidatus Borrarchaeum sp.]
MNVFVSWSGGKESSLALYKALKEGLKVGYLFTMLNEDGLRSRGHGLRKEVIEAQAKAIQIPIIYGKATWDSYEDEFKRVIRDLKNRGIEGGVFGDLDFQENRDWVEKVCSEVGLQVYEPLWKQKYEIVLAEFMDRGFEAIIVSAKSDLIDSNWIGHPLNWDFIEFLRRRKIDLCGENGEYHTLVTNGPIFKRHLKILESRELEKTDRWLLDILKSDII